MTKNALVLVHTAPEVQEATDRQRHRTTSTGAPNAYDYAYRENAIRKEVGKLAMQRLHNALSNDTVMSGMRADTQLAFIREALDRAYGRSMTPLREPQDPDFENEKVGKATLRDTLMLISERGNLPEMLKAKRANSDDVPVSKPERRTDD